jgi:acetylornithine deacetylase/succinyl-diaminopimelate desuccinylase-like protein
LKTTCFFIIGSLPITRGCHRYDFAHRRPDLGEHLLHVGQGEPRLRRHGARSRLHGDLVAEVDVSTLIFGPGSLTKEAHRADESVPLAQVHTAARVLALTAVRFLA